MTSESNKPTKEAVPSALIAQAEAAIYGNLEDDEPSPHDRRHARHHEGTARSSGDTPSSSSTRRPSNLAVPSNESYYDSAEPPPAYGNKHNELELSQDGFDTQAKISDDGRINININQKTRKLSDLLVPALRNQLSLVAQEDATPLPPGYLPPALGGLPGQTPPPQLNVVINVVGSRGDVQPFVALGKILKSTYGHRVRLATHPTFKGFVEENGLEFFSIGGDPSELMAFMVKNPGLMPGIDSLKSGDVGKRRKGMEEIVLGCWRSCIEAGDGLGPAPVKSESQVSLGLEAGINMDTNPSDKPFVADAIIANPPSFAHIHIAEKLGIPLHMMFTMPWSPTQSFPHPLANIQSSNADVNMTNFISYALVEMMTWQGLGDVINRFRERALGLDPISLIWAPGMLSRLRVPYTYCWSPALIPKPKDWGKQISISGFYFLSLASSYTPEQELATFLANGPPPVYIGFGSIVVDDPNAMTTLIFEAVKKSGIRALVSKGWGGLGGDALDVPEGVFMLGNVPHDWLFQHVSCVVHHGGAGTTAAGIATGKPTVVVPFFGDQPFWGAMTARAGAGPPPIPYKQLTADKLAAAITDALKPETLAKAQELGAKIKEEKGTEVGGKSFHDHLDVDNMRCSLTPHRVAVWRVKRTQTKLSALAANVLASENLISFADLKLNRSREYETEDGPWDPISGGASALLGTIASLSMGVADFPIEIFRKVKRDKEARASTKESSTDSAVPNSLVQNQSRDHLPLDERSLSSVDASLRQVSESSAKTSYESTQRSSDDIATPLTPTTTRSSTSNILSPGITHTNSLRQVLQDNMESRQSRSGSGADTPKAFDPSKLTIENAIGAGKGISRIVGAGLKSPMDFTLGLARGFHNAPKLYGDDTVRPQEKVTDFQSGLKAAGREFGYGMFDGITGLVTQPLRGAEKEGTAGLIKGIGKGIAGVVLKPGAAIWGLPGYTFMGIHKEVRKLFGSSVLNYIIAARTAQGFEDAQKCSREERMDIIKRWNEHKREYQNVKQKVGGEGPDGQGTGNLSPRGFFQTRHLTFDERKKLDEDRKAKRGEERRTADNEGSGARGTSNQQSTHDRSPGALQNLPLVNINPPPTTNCPTGSNQTDFEEAIHASVAATSRGNLDEDLMIERAIRASVAELQGGQSAGLSDREVMDRAIRASVVASQEQERRGGRGGNEEDDREHETQLAKAIQESLRGTDINRVRRSGGDSSDGSGDSEGGFIEMRNEESENDEDFKRALRESREDHEKRQTKGKETEKSAAGSGGMTEEEIVLEYVKKQSLAEDQHKRAVEEQERLKVEEKKKMDMVSSAADDEALERAIQESLRGAGGSGGV
ncbi:glycosyltransferase family 1 protein [Sclerotinia borealis F-4128]|uniref:Glycosyltransferase family 1 protein n=1 Tax=Sclerotinia borealis (strain F-4128) TaxID=1432307 RepID=W9CWP5_SCLBF|nr:glycosyltransferase family 1 protein [Sclerotinia borealis F-4128]